MARSLNIVSFDIPFPANYGGVIDVYYKLYWLKKAGINIHLHCFYSGRKPSTELESLCESVSYYPRRKGLLSNLSLLPYTVKSRQSKELKKNLLANDSPVLFEVLHTCYLLADERFKHRQKIYRHSNIEHEYYAGLSKTEKGSVKKIFLKIEAWKLKRFEAILKHADTIMAVNQKDTAYFQVKFPAVKSLYIPSFHPNAGLSVKPGRGEYLLVHGNLSISENYEAVAWMMDHVFAGIGARVIVAGLNPPGFLKERLAGHANVRLVESPGLKEMEELVRDAHIHLLYTAQPTGLKLKLLNVLFNGRFVICNTHMLSGTGLKANESLLVAETPGEFIQAIHTALSKEFSPELIAGRTALISGFDNVSNAGKLIGAIFQEEE